MRGVIILRGAVLDRQDSGLPHAVFDEVDGAPRGISSAAVHTGGPPPSYARAREGGTNERWLAMRAGTVEKKRGIAAGTSGRQWVHRGWGFRNLSGHPDTAENKRRAWANAGLGHGLINWCDDVRFTPESRHSEPTPEMSAFDPKRTFAAHGHWPDRAFPVTRFRAPE